MSDFRFNCKLIACIVMLAFLAGCGSGAAPTATLAPTLTPGVEGIFVFDPPGQINDFTLTNQSAKPMHLTDLKGKLTLITFGYTHCPDVCPITLARFRQIKTDLDQSAAQVNFVFVSVDGRRDTPKRLMDYLKQFDPAFIGLTGDEETVRQVAKDYGAVFYAEGGSSVKNDYTVTHTNSSYLLDRDGQLRRKYSYDLQHDTIAADIKQALQS